MVGAFLLKATLLNPYAAYRRRTTPKANAFKFICPCAGRAVLLKQKNQNFGGFDSPEPLNDISSGEALGVTWKNFLRPWHKLEA